MDVLSDILRIFELQGTLYFRAELTAPFALEVPENEHAARFHIALAGECRVRVGDNDEFVRLGSGDLILVPHGAAHVIADAPGRPIVPLEQALAAANLRDQGSFRFGGGGEQTTLVCGHFAFARGILHPLLAALPEVLYFGAADGYDFRWIDDVMRYFGEEADAARPGREAVLGRLAEILFIHMLRAYIERSEQGSTILGALADPQLGRALAAIHADPGSRWTLRELAQAAGMSRTVFAERFQTTVGLTPMQYLTRWRIELAKAELTHTRRSVAEIASAVGYHSEAAFSRAFKRFVGVGPGAYRGLGDDEPVQAQRSNAGSSGTSAM